MDEASRSEHHLAVYHRQLPEIMDRVGRANAEDENSEVEFVRNGIFEHIGGLADPSFFSRKYILRHKIPTSSDYMKYHLALQTEQKALEECPSYEVRRNGYGPKSPYNPAYSDYLFSMPSVSPRTAKLAKSKDGKLTPLTWTVPYRGRPGDYCGYLKIKDGLYKGHFLQEYCDNWCHLETSALHCWRPGCTRCATAWAKRKAREFEERSEAYQVLQDMIIGQDWRHVVFSPPQDVARGLIQTKEGLDKLYGMAVEMAHKMGLKTGLIALHPWRRNKDDVADSGNKLPSYVWRAAPHFHLICWGRIDSDTSLIFKETGWIVKMIDSEEERSLAGTVSYILSHVGLAVPVRKTALGRQLKAFRLFGGLSHGKLRRIDIIETAAQKQCKTCDLPVFYLRPEKDPVIFSRRTQVFCLPKDLDVIRLEVADLKQVLSDEGKEEDVIKYYLLQYYEDNPRVATASKLMKKRSSA
jgi:hypothetical protein